MHNNEALYSDLLKRVSRSFYLSMRILPRDMRRPVSLAYLLARAADTIADSSLVPADQRRALLEDFLNQLRDFRWPQDYLANQVRTDAQSSESALLASIATVFVEYEKLDNVDREQIRNVVSTLISGMLFDMQMFPPNGTEPRVRCLETEDQMDHYTYMVAGCVGEFWTRQMLRHAGNIATQSETRMIETGVRFGKALQLTNILRDIPEDFLNARCYLPKTDLEHYHLDERHLLEPVNRNSVKVIVGKYIEKAMNYYADAQEYALSISKFRPRLRLAALWPSLIGLTTLERLAANPDWLYTGKREKISRGEVYRLVALSTLFVFSNTAVKRLFDRRRHNIVKHIL